MRTSSRQKAWALSEPRLSSPGRMRKKCCYGQKNVGSICSSLSPSPTHLSHTRIITLSRIKCERYIFIKKWVRSFIEVVIIVHYVSAYICICVRTVVLWIYNTRKLRVVWNKSWKEHSTKQQLYDRLLPISQSILIRQTRHAGDW